MFWYIQAYIGAVKHWGLTTLSPAFCKFAVTAKINVNNVYKNFSISSYQDAANLLRGNVYDLRALKHIKFPPKINLQEKKNKPNTLTPKEYFASRQESRCQAYWWISSGSCCPNTSLCSVVTFLACMPDWNSSLASSLWSKPCTSCLVIFSPWMAEGLQALSLDLPHFSRLPPCFNFYQHSHSFHFGILFLKYIELHFSYLTFWRVLCANKDFEKLDKSPLFPPVWYLSFVSSSKSISFFSLISQHPYLALIIYS